MSKLSKRAIELFVAGALALIGFRVLIGLPYLLSASSAMIGVRLVSSLVTALALPIGIAILLSRASAILCAQIYLWLIVVSGCVAIPVYCRFVPEQSGRIMWRIIPESLVAAVLLAVIFLSRSRRFKNEQDV
jgi:hypothetical protein